MKIVKISIVMALCSVGTYYGMLYVLHKPAVGMGVDEVQPSIEETITEPTMQALHDEPVVIQTYHTMVEEEPVMQEDAEQVIEFTTSIESYPIAPHDSFVTTKFNDGAQLDPTVQQSFDLLIAHNMQGLLDLIVQSNNNVLVPDSCKTCAIDAILKKVSKRKVLTLSEIISLQRVIENLYKFVHTMQTLGQKTILTYEQFLALKNLNTSQVSMNQITRESRQAATFAALQSLKNIDMVQRQG